MYQRAGAPGACAVVGYQHSDLRALDWSYSGNDIRNRIMASGVYELPVGSGKRFDPSSAIARAVLGGWALSLIAELRSGAPYGVTEQTNTTNVFSASQRSDITGDPKFHSSRSRAQSIRQWFDTSAFQAPGQGRFGGASRNVGFGPGFFLLDTSVQKSIPITERIRSQFRADFFNAPNRPNFSSPASIRGRGDFGRILSTTGNARQIQLSLRIEF